MDDSDFQDFCYDEYKRSHSSVEDVYRRYPFALTVIVVLTTATVAISSNDHWARFFVSVDATLYYFGLLGFLASLALAAVWLVWSVLPRQYEGLSALRDLSQWRDEYRAELVARGDYTEEQIDAAVAKHAGAALTGRLIEAVDWNTSQVRERLRLYNRSIYAVSVAVVFLAVAAFSFWVLRVRSHHEQSTATPSTVSSAASQSAGPNR